MSHKRHEPCCHENMVKCTPWRYDRMEGIVPLILLLGARWKWVFSITPRLLYHGERGPITHWIGSWWASGLNRMLWTSDRSVSSARNRTQILWTSSSQPSPRRRYVHMKLGGPKFLKFEIFLVSDRIRFQGLYLWIGKRKQVIPALCKSQRKCGRGCVLSFTV